MNKAAQRQLNDELKKASSVSEMFRVLEKFYDLDNCKPGSITKSIMVVNLQKGVGYVGAKPKPQYR